MSTTHATPTNDTAELSHAQQIDLLLAALKQLLAWYDTDEPRLNVAMRDARAAIEAYEQPR